MWPALFSLNLRGRSVGIVRMVSAWSNQALWILNWALLWLAWYLVAAAWRSGRKSQPGVWPVGQARASWSSLRSRADDRFDRLPDAMDGFAMHGDPFNRADVYAVDDWY